MGIEPARKLLDMMVMTVAVAVSMLFTAIVGLLLRQRASIWAFFGLTLLLVLSLQASSERRILSAHGLMHASFAYEIYEHGLRPEHPLLAGWKLSYPYGHHALMAGVMRLVPVSPPGLFVATNIICLLLMMLVLQRIARHLHSDPRYTLLAVLMALFGSCPFAKGATAAWVVALGFPDERRYLPLIKFFTANGNQLGLLLFAVALLGLVKIVGSERPRFGAYAWVALGIVGAGLFYPLAWVGVVGCAASTCVYLLALREREARIRAGVLTLVVALGVLLVLPWLLWLDQGRAGSGIVELLPSVGNVWRNIRLVVLVMAAPTALCWLTRDALLQAWRRQPRPLGLLLLCVATLQGIFVMAELALASEYKFLALSQLPLAFVLALSAVSLLERHRAVALMLVFAVSFPLLWQVSHELLPSGRPLVAADPLTTRGRFVQHRRSVEQKLYDWILEQTPVDAVFVDTHLTIPALARRRLLIGLDTRRESGELGHRHDGWSMLARTILERVTRCPPTLVERRRRMAQELLSEAQPPPGPQSLEAVRAEVPERPVFVVTRSAAARERLQAAQGFTLAYSDETASVFKVSDTGL